MATTNSVLRSLHRIPDHIGGSIKSIRSIPVGEAWLLFLAVAFAVSRIAAASGQESAQYLFSHPKSMSIAPGATIEIQIGYVLKDDWIGIAERESSEALSVQTAQVVPVDALRGKTVTPPLKPLDPDSLISQQGNRLSLSRDRVLVPLCVYVEVPKNSSVWVLNGNSTIYRGTIGSGVLISGLNVTRQPITKLDLIDIIIRSQFPPNIRKGGRPADPYTVAFDLVKSRIKKYIQPSFEAGNGPVLGSLLVELVVGADGRVAEVIYRRGPLEYFDRAREALAEWEFEPLLVDGKAVSFRTMTFLQVRQ